MVSTRNMHVCLLPFGQEDQREYVFRSPTVYDLPALRRSLTRRRVRRPSRTEFRVAAIAGVEAMAEQVGDADEGARQQALIARWYELLDPTDEDRIDEPDFEARAAELLALERERLDAQRAILPQIAAIEANLERHWPPYADLLADRRYYDEVSNIEVVRLLLVKVDGAPLDRDGDGLLTEAAYQALAHDHRAGLTAFALRLLAPDEGERKN